MIGDSSPKLYYKNQDEQLRNLYNAITEKSFGNQVSSIRSRDVLLKCFYPGI